MKESLLYKKDIDPFYKDLKKDYKVYRVKKKGPHYVFGEAPDFWDPGEDGRDIILPRNTSNPRRRPFSVLPWRQDLVSNLK